MSSITKKLSDAVKNPAPYHAHLFLLNRAGLTLIRSLIRALIGSLLEARFEVMFVTVAYFLILTLPAFTEHGIERTLFFWSLYGIETERAGNAQRHFENYFK